MASPVTQSTTAKAMVASMILSSRLMGPIFSSRCEAAAGASGVSLISGGHSCKPNLHNLSDYTLNSMTFTLCIALFCCYSFVVFSFGTEGFLL